MKLYFLKVYPDWPSEDITFVFQKEENAHETIALARRDGHRIKFWSGTERDIPGEWDDSPVNSAGYIYMDWEDEE